MINPTKSEAVVIGFQRVKIGAYLTPTTRVAYSKFKAIYFNSPLYTILSYSVAMEVLVIVFDISTPFFRYCFVSFKLYH